MLKRILLILSLFVYLQAGSNIDNPAFPNSFFQIGNNPAQYGLKNCGELHGTIQSFDSKTYYDVSLNTGYFGSVRYKKDSTENFILSGGFPVLHNLFLGANYNFNTEEYSAGMIYAPFQYLSIGARLNNVFEPDFVNLGIGIRPFTRRLTLGYMFASPLNDDFQTTESNSYYYLESEIMDGLLLEAKYDDQQEEIILSAGLNFSHANIMLHKNENSQTASIGIYSKLLNKFSIPKTYHYLTLKGKYQKENYGIFGSGKNFNELILSLKRFQKSKRTKGLVIDVKDFSMGFSELLELYEALLDVRQSGKKIYLYSVNGNNATFLLASAATKHIVYEDGIYNIKGFGMIILYGKEFFDSLGVKVNIERIGKYKSAAEPFIRNNMSDEAYEQYSMYLEDIKKIYVNAVSKGRQISKEKVREIIHNGPYTMREAKKKSFMNDFVYPDEISKYITKSEKIKKLKYRDLNEFNSKKSFIYNWQNPKINNAIAVIYATGTIVNGKGQISPFNGNISMGAETICARLKVAAKDPRVKAIVLRVDSPGGSAYASDLIWHEIQKIAHPKKDKKKTKPVVVSMGNLAASGGYYISCNSNYIFAEENTLTGSIGIFGATLSIEKMLEKIHINTDSLSTDENALFKFAFYDPSETENKFFKKAIETGYKSFIAKVAKGRNMKLTEVDSIGRGRIWMAKDAEKIGLVDEIGDLNDAIKKAAKLAKIRRNTNVSIQPYPSAGYGIKMPFLNVVSYKVFSKYPLLSEIGERYYSLRLYSDDENLMLLPFEEYEFAE